MRLETTLFDDGRGLESVIIHGIGPARAMLDHLGDILTDPRSNDAPEARAAILDAIIERLDDAERALNRFGAELVKPAERAAG